MGKDKSKSKLHIPDDYDYKKVVQENRNPPYCKDCAQQMLDGKTCPNLACVTHTDKFDNLEGTIADSTIL